MRVSLRGVPVIGTLFLALAAGALAADAMGVKGGKAYSGRFRGYQNGRFHFLPDGGKEVSENPLMVLSLSLEPSSRVIVKVRGQKDREDLKLKAYEPPNFVFEDKNGQELRLAASQLTLVDMGMDFRRFDAQPAALPAGDAVPLPGPAEVIDIEKAMKPGLGAIVHFHMASVGASVRQGNYVESIVEQNKTKLVLVRIDINSWDDPAAVRYGIKSAPQFWFYNRKGGLVTKLVERFTDNDIEKAALSARR